MKLGEKSYNRYHLLIAVGQAECQGVESFIKVNSVSCPQAYSLLHISQKPGNSQALQVNPVLQDARQDKAKCQKRATGVLLWRASPPRPLPDVQVQTSLSHATYQGLA